MRTLPLLALSPLLVLAACSDSERSVDAFDGVDNRTDAGMTFVDDGDTASSSSSNSPEETPPFPESVDVRCPTASAAADVYTEVDAGVLTITSRAGADVSACELHVPSPWVRSIVVRGNGDVDSDATFRALTNLDVRGNGSVHLAGVDTGSLTVELSGNGDVTLDSLLASDVDFELTGNGDTTAAGVVDHALLYMNGNGNFHGADLEIGELEADVSGNATAEVNVTGTGDIAVSGSAAVVVSGAGDVVTDVTGGGTISIL